MKREEWSIRTSGRGFTDLTAEVAAVIEDAARRLDGVGEMLETPSAAA